MEQKLQHEIPQSRSLASRRGKSSGIKWWNLALRRMTPEQIQDLPAAIFPPSRPSCCHDHSPSRPMCPLNRPTFCRQDKRACQKTYLSARPTLNRQDQRACVRTYLFSILTVCRLYLRKSLANYLLSMPTSSQDLPDEWSTFCSHNQSIPWDLHYQVLPSAMKIMKHASSNTWLQDLHALKAYLRPSMSTGIA